MPEPNVRDGHQVVQGHHSLRTLILSGELEPGTEISQTDLGEYLDIGRTPLREILRLLDQEGLVRAAPNRPVKVAELSAADAEAVYISRLTLELVAIRLTVPLLSEADLAELEGLMTQMDYFAAARDNAGREGPHRMFHMRLIAGAPERIRREIAHLYDHASRYRYVNAKVAPDAWALRQREHRAVLDALKARDIDAAINNLATHYVVSFKTVLDGIDDGYEAVALRQVLVGLAPRAVALL